VIEPGSLSGPTRRLDRQVRGRRTFVGCRLFIHGVLAVGVVGGTCHHTAAHSSSRRLRPLTATGELLRSSDALLSHRVDTRRRLRLGFFAWTRVDKRRRIEGSGSDPQGKRCDVSMSRILRFANVSYRSACGFRDLALIVGFNPPASQWCPPIGYLPDIPPGSRGTFFCDWWHWLDACNGALGGTGAWT
jgi:hypothetical protein